MNRLKPHCTRVLLFVALAALLGAERLWAQTSAPSVTQQPINKFCPVLPDNPVDPDITTTYQGRIIGFCCTRCRAKFEANPERYAARLAALLEPASADEPASVLAGPSPAQHEEGPGVTQTDEDMGTHAAAPPAHQEAEHGRADEREAGRAHDEDEQANAGKHAETEEDEEHEHAAEGAGLAKLIAWLGGFHPAAVNFPIAMLVGAAVAELLLMATKRQFFLSAGRFCLWFGGLGALTAGVLGWCFAGFHLTDDTWIMTTHRWLGTATVLWAVMTLVVGERTYRASPAAKRGAYRAVLFVSAIAVLVTGFFGGAMIYGLDHYAW